jgi:hypothetical protein
MWFDNVTDAQGVDIIFETAGEGACCLFTTDLGEGVPKCGTMSAIMSAKKKGLTYESSGSTSYSSVRGNEW